MKVRAIRLGYYGERRRREGEVFELAEGDALGKWMESLEDELVRKPLEKKQPRKEADTDSPKDVI